MNTLLWRAQSAATAPWSGADAVGDDRDGLLAGDDDGEQGQHARGAGVAGVDRGRPGTRREPPHHPTEERRQADAARHERGHEHEREAAGVGGVRQHLIGRCAVRRDRAPADDVLEDHDGGERQRAHPGEARRGAGRGASAVPAGGGVEVIWGVVSMASSRFA